MHSPRSTHHAAVLLILGNIKGTFFHGIHFSAHSSLDLQAYSHVDWAGDPTDHRSTTGYCFFLVTSLISGRSKRQTLVSHSSTEAEYRALANTISEIFWLRWLLQDMCVSFTGNSSIHCHNTSAIQIAHNDFFHEHTKHIEIDCYSVRHHIRRGTHRLHYVSSTDQLVHIITKAHPPRCHRDLIFKLKLASSLPS